MSQPNKRKKFKSLDILLSRIKEVIGSSSRICSDECSYKNCGQDKSGLLIKCSNKKCSLELHTACAHDIGSIEYSYNSEGVNLCVLCKDHYKPVIYCVCKSPHLDEDKSMIGCDACGEWYHFECLGLNEKEDYDEFRCTFCKKSDEKEISARSIFNSKKDILYEDRKRGQVLASIVDDLEEVVCPLLDRIYFTEGSEPSSKVSISELEDVIEIFNNNFDIKNYNIEELLRHLGIDDVYSSWKVYITTTHKSFKSSIKKIKELFKLLVQYINKLISESHASLPLNLQFKDLYKEICHESELLEKSVQNSPVYLEQDHMNQLESFQSAHDWISSYFEILNKRSMKSLSKNELLDLYAEIQSHVKEGREIFRESFDQDVNYYDLDESMDKLTVNLSNICNSEINWINQSDRIFTSVQEWSLEKLKFFMDMPQGIYTKESLIFDSFNQLIAASKDLDQKIDLFLNCSEDIEYSEFSDTYEKIYNQIQSSQLTSPTIDTLCYFVPLMDATKAWQRLSSSRQSFQEVMYFKNINNLLLTDLKGFSKPILNPLPQDDLSIKYPSAITAVSLEDFPNDLTHEGTPSEGFQNRLTHDSSSSTTSDPSQNYYPISKVFERFLLGFEALFDDEFLQYETHISSCHEAILEGKVELLPDLLSKLKNMMFISKEEHRAEFLLTGQIIKEKIHVFETQELIIAQEASQVLYDLNSLLANYLENDSSDTPQILTDLYLFLQNSYKKLSEEVNFELSNWKYLNECIDLGFRTNNNISIQHFKETFNLSANCKIRDVDTYEKIVSLFNEASHFESILPLKLENLIDCTDESVKDISFMMDESNRLPLDDALKLCVTKRYNIICSSHECQDLINTWALKSNTDLNLNELREFYIDFERANNSYQDITDSLSNYDSLDAAIIDKTAKLFKIAYYDLKFEISFKSREDIDVISSIHKDLLNYIDKELNSIFPDQFSPLNRKIETLNFIFDISNQLNSKFKICLDSFQEIFNKVESQISTLNDTSSSTTPTPIDLVEVYSLWDASTKPIVLELKNIFKDEEALTNFCMLTIHNEASSLLELIDTTNYVTNLIINISSNSAINAISESGTYKTFISINDLDALNKKACTILEENNNFSLLNKSLEFLNIYLAEAIEWTVKYNNLLPPKLTRKMAKTEAKLYVYDDLIRALSEPIIRSVHIPLSDSFVFCLNEVKAFKGSLISFFLPENADASQDANDSLDSKELSIENSDIEFISEITQEIVVLHDKLESLQIKLEEAEILTWINKIKNWIEDVPCTVESLGKLDNRMKLKNATEFLIQAQAFFILSKPISQFLNDNNIAKFTHDGELDFNPLANKLFFKLKSRIHLLQSEMSRTTKWIVEYDFKKISNNPEDLISHKQAFFNLTVFPDYPIEGITELKKKKVLSRTKSRDILHDIKKKSPDKNKAKELLRLEKITKGNSPYYEKLKKRLNLLGDPETVNSSMVYTPLSNISSPIKKKQNLCAGYRCGWNAIENQFYCSDACAVDNTAELYKELLKSRSDFNKKNYFNTNSTENFILDYSAYFFKQFSVEESISDLYFNLNKSETIIDPSKNIILNSENKGDKKNDIPGINQTKSFQFLPLLGVYPNCSSSLFLRKFSDTESTSTRDQNKSYTPSIIDMRTKVSNNLEEVFLASLTRIGHNDPIILASVLSSEMEEELYNKYKRFKINDNEPKNSYKKHQLNLIQNLRKEHNDSLVKKLSSQAMNSNEKPFTVLNILEMTSDQLADPKALLAREALRNKEYREALVLSSQETIIKKQLNIDVNDEIQENKVSNIVSPKNIDEDSKKIVTASNLPEENEYFDMRPSKNISLVKRYSETNASKASQSSSIPKTDLMYPSEDKSEYVVPAAKIIDKTKQNINVLELLKAAKMNQNDSSSDMHKNNNQNDSNNITMNLYPKMSQTTFPMTSSDRKQEFVLSDSVHGTSIKFICYSSDRRFQGLLPENINLKGRLEFKNVISFINDCSRSAKRIVTVVNLLSKYYSDENFGKLNHELTTARKNIAIYDLKGEKGDELIFYIFPCEKLEELKLSCKQLAFPENREINKYKDIFIGVIISKKQGPVEFITANPKELKFDENGDIIPTPEEMPVNNSSDSSEKKRLLSEIYSDLE